MKYSMYAKKNEKNFKKKTFNALNWNTTKEGYKICPNGHIFDEHFYDGYEQKGEYLRIIQNMKSEKNCVECLSYGDCCKSKQIISRDVVLEEFYREVDENLSTEFGKKLKKQRSIQVEGAFGLIKQDMGFTRFKRRGLKNIRMEFLIVCIGYNLKKYHKYRSRKEKESKRKRLLN